MARQGGMQSRTRGGISEMSKGFSIKNETSNIKRSLFLQPASHSMRSGITWVSSLYIFLSILFTSMIINTSTVILCDGILLGKMLYIICAPRVEFLIFVPALIFGVSFIYKKVFKITMAVAVYILILSFTVCIPVILVDSIFYIIMHRSMIRLYGMIFSIFPMVIIGIISQYLATINLSGCVDPSSDSRTNIIRQVTMIIGNFICGLVFYLSIVCTRDNAIIIRK
ncbi:hypothetical protein NEAUS04_2356 [Nematocida ausubeli]|uniref:Uncharacterized protein n=1 Tax=Nematocida ausubeli (strain ATCC PRA-371 / ERTm2) TaxID=1913371 RepID=A0A086J0G2_NEMA1|nr:uncharacterized protein NESG_01608 [Nematocida ausubeli]KAI5137414.1 hypothetical protein NEAUS06_2228 [Nematocida ausubeli]KAI5164904.1 hypothetical protein NEAUS04_2356 [Nematocida ausubeli]KFG25630.1 hypothetical protein NESG_01608 [Nematocida ausubeli]